jgi:hypothetical protein
MDVINLRRRFGRRYRVTYEESYWAEHGPNARIEDPQLMILLCRYGHMFPWQDSTLAASVDGYPKVASRLRRLKCCRIVQDGDFGELTVTFDLANFPQVAQIMRPRRRRQLSKSARQRLVEAGSKTRFQPGTRSHFTAHREASEPQGDQEAVQGQLALFGG